MSELFSTLLSYKILASHILLPVLMLVVMHREGWGRKIFGFVGKYALHLAFVVSLGALVGSLIYSNVIGFEACVLCWWIRVFLYPQVVLYGVALWGRKGSRDVFTYALPLTLAALVVSLYFSYYSLGGPSLLPCTTEGEGCSKIFVKEFGYITIPMMALTASLYLIFLTWVNKLYVKENRNS